MVELGKIYTVFLQKEHKSIRKDWQAICKPPKLCFQFAHQKKNNNNHLHLHRVDVHRTDAHMLAPPPHTHTHTHVYLCTCTHTQGSEHRHSQLPPSSPFCRRWAAEADNSLMKQGQVWKAHLQKQWLQLVSHSAPPAPSVALGENH